MSETTRPPELIISLSQDRVGVRLLENAARNKAAWQISFPVSGIFMEEEIGKALDMALQENPELIDDFTCVYVVVVDRPNLYMPRYLVEEGKIDEMASKYLRVRAGDMLALDETSTEDVMCYSLPISALNIIQEYYSKTDSIHLISLLWKEVKREVVAIHDVGPILYFCMTGNNLIVLCSAQGRLVFSKRFNVRQQADVYYYLLACTRLLHPARKIQIQIQEESTPFELSGSVSFSIDQQLYFPSVPHLLSIHYPCES